MWKTQCERLHNDRTLKFKIEHDGQQVSNSEVLSQWQGDADFRTYFNAILSDSPFSAFRWETPSVSIAQLGQPFEFVLLNSPGLARTPDAEAFAEHFRKVKSNEAAISFRNLGNDATLIVPVPQGPAEACGHVAAFVRLAPTSQQHELWQLVGKVMQSQVGHKPIWLSTAGAGVSWLHVRIDDRPKYYGYEPYRDPAYERQ
jgi:hypothetical protein